MLSNRFAIYKYFAFIINSTKMKNNILSFPILWNCDASLIPHRIYKVFVIYS